MNKQLEVQSASVCYGSFVAVDSISMALNKGDIGCLLGPSGCGKTSLLRAIAGFEPLTAGQVSVDGRLLSAPGTHVLPEQRKVGMVFQDFALFPHLNIARNVAFGLGKASKNEQRQRVAELLELVGLPALAKAWPHELSGGQQQRVALARALAPKPDILLLDEPFSSLDTALRESLAAEVRALLKQHEVTAVLVTHDQQEAFAMADHITLLNAGHCAQQGTPQELYRHPASEFVARFIGEGTLVNTTIDSTGALNLGMGAQHCAPLRAHAGKTVQLLLRPNDIRFDANSTHRLIITKKQFRGSGNLYHLLLPDNQPVLCLTSSDIDAAVGDSLPVSLNLQQPVLFESGAGPSN